MVFRRHLRDGLRGIINLVFPHHQRDRKAMEGQAGMINTGAVASNHKDMVRMGMDRPKEAIRVATRMVAGVSAIITTVGRIKTGEMTKEEQAMVVITMVVRDREAMADVRFVHTSWLNSPLLHAAACRIMS